MSGNYKGPTPDNYEKQYSGHTFDRRFFDWYAKQRSEDEEKEYRNKMEIQMEKETGKIFPYGQIGKSPIFGPPTLQQIWGAQDFGKDWQMKGTESNPLTERETNLLMSELMKDISIEKNLGRGDYGSVWKVKALYRSTQDQEWPEKNDKPDYQYFAMKVLRHSSKFAKLQTLGDRMYFSLEVLLNEMYSLRYLKHQNICKILDMIAIPDHLTGFPYSVVCLFMEMCDGDLKTLLKEGRKNKQLCPNGALPEHLCKHYFRDVLKGLEYIHKNGVVHCDLDSCNILYLYQRVRGQPVDLKKVPYEQKILNSIFKLGDFGLSHTQEYFEYRDKGKPDLKFRRNYGIRTFPAEMWYDCFEAVDTLIKGILPVGATTNAELYAQKYPQHWQQFSKEFRDFFRKYCYSTPMNMSAAGLLNEPWLAGEGPIQDKERDRKGKESEDPSPEVKKVRRLKCPHCGFIVKRSANPDSV